MISNPEESLPPTGIVLHTFTIYKCSDESIHQYLTTIFIKYRYRFCRRSRKDRPLLRRNDENTATKNSAPLDTTL